MIIGWLSWAVTVLGIGRNFFRSIFLFVAASTALASSAHGAVPAKALIYLPHLLQAQQQVWPDAPAPWTMAGQVEQESCISLTHSRCWDPGAELKTTREYGFGFGQITRAYNANGSIRFDKFSELVAAHPSLARWTWENRFDPKLQFVALAELDKQLWLRLGEGTDAGERWAFTLAAYNGGLNGVLRDQLLCKNVGGCIPGLWFGHVERYSSKSRVTMPGYGRSPFEINREYPRLILGSRRLKYQRFWESE